MLTLSRVRALLLVTGVDNVSMGPTVRNNNCLYVLQQVRGLFIKTRRGLDAP